MPPPAAAPSRRGSGRRPRRTAARGPERERRADCGRVTHSRRGGRASRASPPVSGGAGARASSSASPASGSGTRGLRSRGGGRWRRRFRLGRPLHALVFGHGRRRRGSLLARRHLARFALHRRRLAHRSGAVSRSMASRGAASRAGASRGAGSGCSGQLVPSPSGTARGSASARGRRPHRRRFARRAGRAHDVRLDHHVARAADHQEMLDIVAADQDQAAAAVDGGGVDHRQPRLAAAGGGGAQPVGAEPAYHPEERAQQRHQNDDGAQDTDRGGYIKAFEHRSSLRPRGMACLSESPEWLTPAVIFAAPNTNKFLTKMDRSDPSIHLPKAFSW